MSNAATRVAAVLERVIDACGRATLYIGLAMIALVATNVLLRYALSLGSVWAQELEWHLLAALILLAMPYALQSGDNVRVDVFYAHYGPAARWAVDLLSCLLLLGVSVLFILLALGYVQQAWAVGETSPDPGGIPWRWAVKSLIPLGYALVVLQQVAALLRLLLAGPSGRPAPAATEAGHG